MTCSTGVYFSHSCDAMDGLQPRADRFGASGARAMPARNGELSTGTKAGEALRAVILLPDSGPAWDSAPVVQP